MDERLKLLHSVHPACATLELRSGYLNMQHGRQLGGIPRFFLYNGPTDGVDLDFLHVEQIRERSGQNDWTIRAHSHPDHVQILLIQHGGGTIRIEDRAFDIPTGGLLVIPAAMVHEIAFRPGTDGFVITAATAFVAKVAQFDPQFAGILDTPEVFTLLPEQTQACASIFASVLHEYTWPSLAQKTAITAEVLRLFVVILRLRADSTPGTVTLSDRDHALLSRYRALIEDHFRTQRSMEFFAAELGITPQRLNQACRKRTGRTASELLHERLIVEAKRTLLFLDQSIAEIGYALGFEDSAYFNRFFARRVGCPPGVYRRSHVDRKDGAETPIVQENAPQRQ
tara:strand:+ start:4693 stop:5712 length:1020 start_codon:yes stop_codon:yes gene_type:complete